MERKRKPLSQLTLDDLHQKRLKLNESQTHYNSKRAGTIAKMTLKNFMCHSFLEVEFDTNINFLIGRNGSGKSAILTALVVGFGAKASVTNRGNSIKGFIKAGKTSASIEITLNNCGPMAYKPSTYGNKIIIQRNITSSGGSNYKVRTSSGEVIATQGKEIQRIAINLNIQIDNPICILNQDTSRNFLSTSDTKQKFRLFMKATRLESLAEEYQKMDLNRKEALSMLKDKGRMLRELDNEIKELKATYENLKSILSLQAKLHSLQLELLWAHTRDSESEFAEKQKCVDSVQVKYSHIEDNIKNKTTKLEDLNVKINELQLKISELKNESEVQNRPQIELKDKINKLQDSCIQKQREKQIVLRSIASKTRDCEALEQEISNFTANLSRLEQEKMQKLKEISSMEEKIKSIDCLTETTQNDHFQTKNSVMMKQEETGNLKREIAQVNHEYASTEDTLRTLKSESDNLLLYGRDMPKVVKAINDLKHKFIQVPRGPLGSYIKIHDKKWAVAIEGFLNPGLLRSFAVDNKQDSALLLKIFDRLWTSGRKPTIITSKFFSKVHDISKNVVRPIDGCLSVYDALEIADPVIANCLIDQTNMERVLLIPSAQKAIELLSDASNVPRNCKQGVTIKGDKYYPDPNYRMYSSSFHQARFLQVNTSDIIVDLEQKLLKINTKKESIQNQYAAIEQEISDQIVILSELSKKLEKLHRAKTTLRQKHEELISNTDPEIGNVQNLEAELNEIKQDLTKKQEIVLKIDNNMKEVKAVISKSEEQLKKLKYACKGFEERMGPLENQVLELALKKKELTTNESFEKKRLLELKKHIDSARVEMEEKQRVMEDHRNQASSVGERMEEIRPVKQLGNEITLTERQIRKIQVNTEKPEEVAKKYQDKLERHRKASEIMKSLEENVRELQVASEKRKKHYKLTEDYFITYIQHSFSNILEYRQFRGNLEIDMDNKTLEMVVIPQQGSQGLTTTANLSGGERSFSTVAFLYSLWQCMEFPFYFLDEFDVYMDKVNRTKVMEILIHHAKSRPELQFVFLTPQDVSFIHDNSVSLHRLEDPQRKRVHE